MIGDIIYDFNFNFPLPLTQENLDRCCRTEPDDNETTFFEVQQACNFWHNKPPGHFNMDGNWRKHNEQNKETDSKETSLHSSGSKDNDENKLITGTERCPIVLSDNGSD